jgi:capsular polysaccharide biosynthesis protein
MNENTKLRVGPIPLVVFAVLFMPVFLLVVITTTLVTFILPESYASTARIKIERVAPAEPRNFQASYDPYLIQTEFEVIQSELILNPVVQGLDLNSVWGRKYQNGGRLNTSETIALLKSRLALRPVRGTSVVEIRALSEDRKEAADIANAIAEAYNDYAVAKSDVMQVQILEHACPALRPTRPNKPLNISLGVVVGVVAGLGVGGLGAWVAVLLARRKRANNLRS